MRAILSILFIFVMFGIGVVVGTCVRPYVVTRVVEKPVPGPTEYVNVPAPGPTQYVVKKVPGKTKTVIKHYCSADELNRAEAR